MMKKAFAKKIFLLISALLSALSFCFLNSVEFNNILVLALSFVVLLYVFFNLTGKKTKSITLLSIILSIFLILGKYLVYLEESTGWLLIVKLITTPIGAFLFFNNLCPYLFERFDLLNDRERQKVPSKWIFIISFIVILLSWIPAWLAEYPGIFTPDTVGQLYQVEGTRAYTNFSPLIHTLIIKLCYAIVGLFSSNVNVIYFAVGFIQMIFMSLVFAYANNYVYERTKKLIFPICGLIFYALVSYNVFYGITISKDSVYAALLLLFVIMIDKYCNNPIKRNVLPVVLVGIFYCLARKNGTYTLLFTIGVLFFVMFKKRFSKTFLILLVTTLATIAIEYPGYNSLLSVINNDTIKQNNVSILSINDEYKDELYDVFYRRSEESKVGKDYFKGNFLYVMAMQQMANVVNHDRELNEKEEYMLEELMPISVFKSTYNPMLVDPLFNMAALYATEKVPELGLVEYAKLWLGLGIRYPHDYIEAYVNMTRYYYYPNRYVNMYYIGTYENSLGLVQENLFFPNYKNNIESFYNSQYSYPIVSSIYCGGTITFVLLIGTFYGIRKKNYSSFVSMLPILGNFLILLVCVPTNDEFRYMYPIAVCLPFIIMHIIVKEDEYDSTMEGGNKRLR